MDYCKNYPLPDWTSGFEYRKTSVSQLPYEEYIGSIDKSASDTNDYKLIRLSNNLVVMCVHDAQAKTAAAALCVNVGSNVDPVELPGLAHFLEHMMFRKDSIDCELIAIDSEYKGLLNKDIRRLNQLERKLSDPNHPYSKFTTGNIETLKQGAKDYGLDLHEELVKFYNKYYSSDIMRLAIYGSQSLDQLVEWAVSKFSDIKKFWNKYVNPSTALTYTRVDVQMWSSKIWKPTISEFKNYSAKTLALYGCLCSEGMDSLDIDKVDKFITTAISRRKEKPETGNNVDILIDELKDANLSVSGAMYMAGESAEREAHTGRALELAIKDYATFGNYANASHTNFATIGMHKTPDGLWLITNYIKFQATQQLEGLRLSDVGKAVVPKYSS
ncbi:metalloprotease [Coemansia furcata]|uniref:Metalloprotease n=1 Tax=Coemansia furcata TaxID=417177 RepID=A0ACC1LL76_9FUNG|nr:metalloprotease [Coemansia furcata]